jgi:plastocyanin
MAINIHPKAMDIHPNMRVARAPLGLRCLRLLLLREIVRFYAIAAGMTGVLAAVGCSSSTAPANGPAGGHSAQVEAVGSAQGCTTSGGGYGGGGTQTCTFFFNPTPDTIKAGTALSFKFDDVGHTVTWDSGPLANIGVAANNGVSNAVVQDGTPAAGTYTWHCSIHTYMHGTLVVTP